jgi:hypothetical protein
MAVHLLDDLTAPAETGDIAMIALRAMGRLTARDWIAMAIEAGVVLAAVAAVMIWSLAITGRLPF